MKKQRGMAFIFMILFAAALFAGCEMKSESRQIGGGGTGSGSRAAEGDEAEQAASVPAEEITDGLTIKITPDATSELGKDMLDGFYKGMGIRLNLYTIDTYSLSQQKDGTFLLVVPRQTSDGRDTETLLEKLFTRGLFTMREGYETGDSGQPAGITAENIFIVNEDVNLAEVKHGPLGGSSGDQYYVQLTFTESGVEKLAEATERLAENKDILSIWLDDTAISAPVVSEAITTGVAIISGTFTADSAQTLADSINTDPLPFSVSYELAAA